MGDVVSLVEKAAETIDEEDAKKMAKKMAKGEFDLDDLRSQLQQMSKMGGMKSILGMLPGMGKLKGAIGKSGADDKMFKQQEAIISSMTKTERKKPKLINASRKKRIAAGSGMQVQDVNKLLKMHMQMAKMMKKMTKMGKGGKMPQMPGMGGMGPGMGGMPGMGGGMPPGFDKLLK